MLQFYILVLNKSAKLVIKVVEAKYIQLSICLCLCLSHLRLCFCVSSFSYSVALTKDKASVKDKANIFLKKFSFTCALATIAT